MGIVFRQSIKTTLINFTGAALGALTIYLSIKSFAAFPAEYGFSKNIISIGAVAQFFVTLGTSNTLLTFAQRYTNGSDKKKLLLTISLLTPLIVIALGCIPFLIFRQQYISIYKIADRPYVAYFFLYIPLLVLLNAVIIPLEQCLLSHSKIAVIAFLREIVLRLLNLLLIVLFLFQCLSYNAFIIGSILIYLVPLISLIVIIARSGNWGISFKWNAFSLDEYREILHFSWYHLLIGISVYLMAYIDGIMLAPYAGMSAVAVYTTAIYLVTLLYIPYKAMSSSSFPALNKTFLENDFNKLNDFFHRSAINILIAATGMTLIMACNLSNIARILPPIYYDIVPITVILMVGRLVDMATGLNTETISISKHYKISFRISLALIIMLIIFYRFLIPRYGIYGAAWGSTLALAVFNILKMYFLWKKMNIQPFTKNTAIVLIISIPTALAGYFMPQLSNPFIDGVLRTALITLIYVLLLLWLKPSEDLSAYLRSIRSNKKLF